MHPLHEKAFGAIIKQFHNSERNPDASCTRKAFRARIKHPHDSLCELFEIFNKHPSTLVRPAAKQPSLTQMDTTPSCTHPVADWVGFE